MIDSVIDILPDEWVYNYDEIRLTEYAKHIEKLSKIKLKDSYEVNKTNNKTEANDKRINKIDETKDRTNGIDVKKAFAALNILYEYISGGVRFLAKNKTYFLPLLPILAAAKQQKISSLEDGLVAYYPFNGNANDESGHGNNGVVHGATLTEDRFGNEDGAYSFNGNNDYTQAAFTHTLWFKPSFDLGPNSGRQDLIYGIIGNARPHMTFDREKDGKIGLYVTVNEIHYDDVKTITNRWLSKQFYNIAFVFDGNSFLVYVNGNLENSVVHTGTNHPLTGITIGTACGASYCEDWFAGIIDEVRIYNRALSEEEIKLLYEWTDKPDLNRGLVANYPFNGKWKWK
jgi:hypothetical protein